MEWMKLCLMPLFTLIVILVIYFCFSGVEGLQTACTIPGYAGSLQAAEDIYDIQGG